MVGDAVAELVQPFHRVGFGLLLKFLELEGRFPDVLEEVPSAAVEYFADLVKVLATDSSKYTLVGLHAAPPASAAEYPRQRALATARPGSGPVRARIERSAQLRHHTNISGTRNGHPRIGAQHDAKPPASGNAARSPTRQRPEQHQLR
ncbi:hypothetical protein ACFY2M_44335 [Streptomyces sp. NPDC001276]|uniref:hypothetical protein n=1 Tax=Streptomyces sp. NPDC001276 TaxID=3364555 RepID=UPI0036AAACA7